MTHDFDTSLVSGCTVTAYHGTVTPFPVDQLMLITHFGDRDAAAEAAERRQDPEAIPFRPAHFLVAQISLGCTVAIDGLLKGQIFPPQYLALVLDDANLRTVCRR